uniref:Potassium channel subfamily K member 16-like n=1 Tax=Phallusia mammillata TaxID=59560 RepID=A0A6F9DFT9_9ASCI|nr:potassium channel subfamily K member 16-like [Phallusia mammillata]
MPEEKNERKPKPEPERNAPSLKGNCIIAVLLAVYILFNLLGAYIFVLLEKPDDNTREVKLSHSFIEIKQKFLQNHSNCFSTQDLEEFLNEVRVAIQDGVNISGNVSWHDHHSGDEKWSLHNAFLLAFTISSTIGYGVVTPVTAGGQMFCILYAFLSIPFTGLLAAKIGFAMAYYIKKATSSICDRIPKAKTWSIAVTTLIGVVIYIVLPSLLLTFVGNEEGWTFVQCLYCVIVTLTTIGFGDLVPDPSSQGGILTTVAVLIWVVAGLAWFATIVNLVATSMRKHVRNISHKVIRPPLKKSGKDRHDDEEISDKDFTKNKQADENGEADKKVKEVYSFNDACIQTEPAMLGPGCMQSVILANIESE